MNVTGMADKPGAACADAEDEESFLGRSFVPPQRAERKLDRSRPRCGACTWLLAAGGLVLLVFIVSWRAVQPTAQSHTATPAATLFCWSVVHPSESTLLRAQWDLREGIFGCDDWRVFTNRSHAEAFAYLPVGRVLHVVDSTMDAPRGGAFNSSLNTPQFLQPWRMLPGMLGVARSWLGAQKRAIEWVVKVDVDTCFHAQRLRNLIKKVALTNSQKQVSPLTRPYVLTAGRKPAFRSARKAAGRGWIQGPIEVLSVAGQQLLARELDNCAKRLAPREHGEDIWAGACILDRWLTDSHGPRYDVIEDPRLLCWRRYGGVNKGSGEYVKDEICPPTTGRHLVAFHPAKTEKALQACYHDDEWVSASSKETLATCSGTRACLTALRTRPSREGNRTCASHIEALLRSSQLTEEQACSRIADEYPLSCGACAAHR